MNKDLKETIKDFAGVVGVGLIVILLVGGFSFGFAYSIIHFESFASVMGILGIALLICTGLFMLLGSAFCVGSKILSKKWGKSHGRFKAGSGGSKSK